MKTKEEKAKAKRTQLNTHSRGIRLFIFDKQSSALIENLRDRYHQAFSLLSAYIFEHGEKWDWAKRSKAYFTHTETGDYANTFLGRLFKAELTALGITKGHASFAKIPISNYCAYRDRFTKRNKKTGTYITPWPCAPIKLKTNKGLRWDSAECRIKDGLLHIPGIAEGLRFKFARGSIAQAVTQHLKTRPFGGTLVNRNGVWIFTCRYTRPQMFSYTPTEWIGTDFNQTNKDWMTLYIPSVGYTSISRPDELQTLEDKILEVNKTLQSKTTTGGKRRYFNNLRESLHAQHLRLVRPKVRELCDLAKRTKCGIIIDAVRPGQRTWGQDKIAQLLPTYCVNHGIPCYINNPAFTSITCPICKHQDKGNRVNTETFLCVSCGYTNNAQHVGAHNCHNFATQAMLTDAPPTSNEQLMIDSAASGGYKAI